MQFLSFSTLFVDEDECEKNQDSCEHQCTNTVGSFTCYCNPGYQLIGSEACDGMYEEKFTILKTTLHPNKLWNSVPTTCPKR